MRICNSEANTCIPLEAVHFDLAATGESLRGHGYEVDGKNLMVVARKDGIEYTIYRTGKLLIHPLAKEKAKEAADRFYADCIKTSVTD